MKKKVKLIHGIRPDVIRVWAIFYFISILDIILLLYLPGVGEEMMRELRTMPKAMIPFVLSIGLGAPVIGIILFQIMDIHENGKPFIALPIVTIMFVGLLIAYVI